MSIKRKFLRLAQSNPSNRDEMEKIAQLDDDEYATMDDYRLHAIAGFMALDNAERSEIQKRRCLSAIKKCRKGEILHRCIFDATKLYEALKYFADRDGGNINPVILTFREKSVEIQGALDSPYLTSAYVLLMAMQTDSIKDAWKPGDQP